MVYTWKQARKLADLSQRKVAAHLGVCVDTYRSLEKSPEKATVETAKKFSAFVGVPVDQLFFASGSTESRK
jgi:DNA-binding XRE family transcriptional regulator